MRSPSLIPSETVGKEQQKIRPKKPSRAEPSAKPSRATHAPGKPSEQVGNQKHIASVGNITERIHTSSVGNITIHTSSVGNIA